METKNTNFLKTIKNMKSSDFAYLGVLFIFIIIVIILFIYSTNFVLSNINKIFSQENTAYIQSLNIDNYKLVEKKLNLPVNSISENPIMQQPIIQIETPKIEDIPSATVYEFNKQSVTLKIANSTSKKGVALILAKKIEETGFSMAFTENEKKQYTTTTILVKESKKEYAPFIEEVVLKSYPKAITKFFKEDPAKVEFDITIIIGIN